MSRQRWDRAVDVALRRARGRTLRALLGGVCHGRGCGVWLETGVGTPAKASFDFRPGGRGPFRVLASGTERSAALYRGFKFLGSVGVSREPGTYIDRLHRHVLSSRLAGL